MAEVEEAEEAEEAAEEEPWEEGEPSQLREQPPTTPAKRMQSHALTALASRIVITVAPQTGTGHMNALTWTQNSKHSFI